MNWSAVKILACCLIAIPTCVRGEGLVPSGYSQFELNARTGSKEEVDHPPTVIGGQEESRLLSISIEPMMIMRELQTLQDAVVAGKKDSLAQYRERLVRISGDLRKLEISAWQSRENVDAGVFLAIVAGDPELSTFLLSNNGDNEQTKALLEFSVALSNSKFKQARELIVSSDSEGLSEALCSQFSVFKAMLLAKINPGEAKKALFKAITIAPGTISEEAALRHLIRIATQTKDDKLLYFSVRNYLTRFPNSLYFDDFVDAVVLAVSQLHSFDETSILGYEGDRLAFLGDTERLDLLGSLARAAAFSGKLRLAKVISEHALAYTAERSQLEARLNLYRLATMVDEKLNQAAYLSELVELRSQLVEVDDIELLDAVTSILVNLEGGFMQHDEPERADTDIESENLTSGNNMEIELQVKSTLDQTDAALTNAEDFLNEALAW